MRADCFYMDYMHHPFFLPKLKYAWSKWQKKLRGRGWNCLYLENHDHPRVISRYGSEIYWEESGKSLAASYLFQQGTPILYQGQEIGMQNIRLSSIDQYEDIQSYKNYNTFFTREREEKRMERIWRSSRDSARTPVQWDDSPNAGFTTGDPWFYVNPNFVDINVADQDEDPHSLLNFYRDAIALRKRLPVVRYGSFRQYYPLSRKLFVYERRSKGCRLLVICSYTEKSVKFRPPKGYDLRKGELILCSHGEALAGNGFTTQPYETRVYLFNDRKSKSKAE
jgi:oligo-1,6-glucosidase